jgi:hypothetical protein
MRRLIALLLLLSPTFVGAQSCELPSELDGLNTGSNMTLLLNDSFISSLSLNTNSPYIVALTENDLVVGSASLADEDLNNGMQSIAVWGDDAIIDSIVGAIPGETISLQIVDGANLYIVNTIPIIFTVNGMSLITSGSITYECTGIVLGCTDTNACNYDLDANEDDGSCINPLEFYHCDGNCILDNDNDGVCDELEIYGCVEPMACNYNPLATETDSCIYAVPNYNCEGECINDEDNDGICDEEEVDGCTNIFACNYQETATEDDGSCIVITADIFYNQLENILTVETQHDSLEITWLYYNSVIPFEHNDTLHLSEDGVYGVLLYDPINDCGSTDTVHINVVGISDTFEQAFKLYPNPASDYLHIELQHEARVTIFNTQGKLMYQTSTQENTIPVSEFPNGLYFLRVEDGNKIETHPWIKQ